MLDTTGTAWYPPPLSPPHTFPNSIFLLITMLYEHQMLPNDSLNCLSSTLDDIKGPFLFNLSPSSI